MKIDVYTLCWNEERMLPFFLRHYESIVERFFVFDDGSTDASLDILRAHPKVRVEPWERADGSSYVISQQRFSNNSWKRSRGEADWVLVCDVDEHFWHPDLRGYLETCQATGITMIPARGYQMVSDEFPVDDAPLADRVREGAHWEMLDKMSFFRPDDVFHMGFQPGRHVIRPQGRLRTPEVPEVKLLHYKLLGLDYVLDRHRALFQRLGPTDIERNFCHHWREDEVRQDYADFRARAAPVV